MDESKIGKYIMKVPSQSLLMSLAKSLVDTTSSRQAPASWRAGVITLNMFIICSLAVLPLAHVPLTYTVFPARTAREHCAISPHFPCAGKLVLFMLKNRLGCRWRQTSIARLIFSIFRCFDWICFLFSAVSLPQGIWMRGRCDGGAKRGGISTAAVSTG